MGTLLDYSKEKFMKEDEKRLAMETIKFPLNIDDGNLFQSDGSDFALLTAIKNPFNIGQIHWERRHLAEFIAKAINRHAELVAENETLREMLDAAVRITFKDRSEIRKLSNSGRWIAENENGYVDNANGQREHNTLLDAYRALKEQTK